ncbi:MAG: isoprenylcysteine carboxylmethyltransferase family protein [Pseudomonas sp.]|jgi:protein-S-isoprenylcysteine O-methyltransferase Ste14|nr:isoprenylcysteine carboxylmethyltransferase family protein [Pseudomonas sp.]
MQTLYIVQISAFILGSILLTLISWRTLTPAKTHGFYRLLAWLGILALLVLNAPVWFDNRYGLLQMCSWWALFSSLVVLFAGVYQLHKAGQADSTVRADSKLFAFEQTTKVVDTGIYRWIRHPLYCSLLLLTWGIAFKQLLPLTVFVALFSSACLYFTARQDERECLSYFGSTYRDYMQRSRMFIPYVF